MTVKDRLKRTALLSVIALGIGGLIGWAQLQGASSVVENGSRPDPAAQQVAGVNVGGPFTLVNQDGKTVTEKDFAGRYKLIYFGFTYCPAICPAELQKITKVMNALGEQEAKNIQPLFVSVDPERDTPDVLKDYVSLFHPRLTGLTGSAEQIEAVRKSYRVFAAKVQDPDLNDYTVDHSSFIYFMSPSDELIGIYRIQDDTDFMVKDIRQKISTAG